MLDSLVPERHVNIVDEIGKAGGGEEVQCGWLTDKYGLSWQVVPTKIREWTKDAAGFERVMHAVMQMKKLEIAALQKAHDGK